MIKSVGNKRKRTSSASHDSLLASTQSDRARLIYSAPFRRLQQKAQVFSLESNSAVRSRLTHSLEVSHIGRYIVAQIAEKIASNKVFDTNVKKYWQENALAISNIVETSCLMHDIGNPPFGHFGEAAIVSWAKSKDNILPILKKAIDYDENPKKNKEDYSSIMEDFINFDGNPQGIRIVTKLQGDDGFNGLNLTYTQLASFFKYVYCPSTMPKERSNEFSKKIGYFNTEKKLIKEIWKELKIPADNRHPLSFIMEASDDISYCISDIEDGIEKKIISLEHFINFFLKGLEKLEQANESDIFNKLKESLNYSKENRKISIFIDFKANLSNILVNFVSDAFIQNYDDYVNFKIHKPIINQETFAYGILKILKTYTSKYLFCSYDAESIEISGYSIITGILKKYQKLLELNKKNFYYLLTDNFVEIKNNDLQYHKKLFNQLPTRHINCYKSTIINEELTHVESAYCEEECMEKVQSEIALKFEKSFNLATKTIEWQLRTHLIIDFISGMTDQFALEFYQLIEGINVNV
ncbi:dGTPase [Thorsellia kenyensis]|uniref:DGTPase n=1 Tax=Thorsellia kenyensis TaxID=1549888 RepID=A0ABV6C6G5_9GAMM